MRTYKNVLNRASTVREDEVAQRLHQTTRAHLQAAVCITKTGKPLTAGHHQKHRRVCMQNSDHTILSGHCTHHHMSVTGSVQYHTRLPVSEVG